MEKVTKRKVFAASASAALVASAVVPAATFAAESNFTDISNLPASEQAAINALVDAGYINGKGAGKFDPYAQMKRAEAATVIAKVLGLDVNNAPDAGFSDVADNYWAKNYINAAVEAGILEGKGDGKFDPEAPMKRAELAQIVVKAFDLKLVEGKDNNFTDVADSYWGKEAIDILYSNGLITGKSETRFAPEERMQRNHVALLLQRAIDPASIELQITGVSALDDTNRFLQINFSQKVDSLEPSNITIEDAKSKERYGVKEVNLSSNGLIAQVELFSHEGTGYVLRDNRDYTITVKANGKTLEYTFNRPAFLDQRVIDVNVSDRQITIWTKAGGTMTLKVPKEMEDFDFQGVLGETISAWYNIDNELVDYAVPQKTAKYDSIELNKKNQVKLLTDNSTHDLSKERFNVNDDQSPKKFALYVNGSKVNTPNGEIPEGEDGYVGDRYNFAKVGYDKSGNVEFVSAYNLDQFLIVDKVEGNEVVGLEGLGTGGAYNAKDATIVKDGKVISVSDLEKGDILFFNSTLTGKNKFAEVYNESVSGEIDTVFQDAVRINGETIDFTYDTSKFGVGYDSAVYVKKDGKTAVVTPKAAEELQAAGNVTVYFDRAGNAVYISGELAKVESNTKTSILTANIRTEEQFEKTIAEIEYVTEEGKEELARVTLDDLDTISVNGTEYDLDDYGVSANETNIVLTGDNGTTIAKAAEGKLINVVKNDDGKITDLEFFTSASAKEGFDSISGSTIKPGDTYIKGKRFQPTTVVFDATDGYDDDGVTVTDIKAKDVKVTTWEDYKGSDFNYADFVYDERNNVVAVVIKKTTTDSKVYEEAVVTKVLRDKDGNIVEIDAYVNNKKETYQVDKFKNTIEKGQPAVLVFSEGNKNLVKEIDSTQTGTGELASRLAQGNVTDVKVGNREVTVGTTPYTLVSDGLVIDVTDKDDIKTKSLSDLRDKKDVVVVLDEKTTGTTFAKYFIIGAKSVEEATDATLAVAADGIKFTDQSGTGEDLQKATLEITFDKAVKAAAQDLSVEDTKVASVAAVDGAEKLVITFEENKAADEAVTYSTFDVVVPANTEANTKETTYVVQVKAVVDTDNGDAIKYEVSLTKKGA